MNMTMRKIGTLVLTVLLIFTVACANKAMKASDESRTPEITEITIKGLKGGDEIVSISKIMELEPVTMEMKSITSSGEIRKKKVKGASLDALLNLYETYKKNYNGIRFIAGDSYSIVVPKEILERREILLAYEIDDKALDEKSQPLMSAIPDERSMYWVKNLVEIELLEEEVSANNKVIFLETAALKLDQEDYTYYESLDKAVKVTDLIGKLNEESDKKGVHLKAVDGLEKDEDIGVFKTGYIKITGKDIPLFLSPELPKGMHVKNILQFSYGDTTYFSLNQGLESLEKKTIEDNEGIPLKAILNEVGLVKGEKYLCIAEDGYEIEISADDVNKGLVYSNDKGGFTLMFEGMPKNTKIKGILSLEAIK